MKKALSETQTLRALAVVRFGHRPPSRPPAHPLQTPESQTGPITIHCAAKLSAQYNNEAFIIKLSIASSYKVQRVMKY